MSSARVESDASTITAGAEAASARAACALSRRGEGFCNIKEWVRELGSISTASNPLTPALFPNGERKRTAFAARLCERR